MLGTVKEGHILTLDLENPAWSFDNTCQRQAEEVMSAASDTEGANKGTISGPQLGKDLWQ